MPGFVPCDLSEDSSETDDPAAKPHRLPKRADLARLQSRQNMLSDRSPAAEVNTDQMKSNRRL
jgi:hypothetical protein